MRTIRWVCPKMCGCELDIHAEWVSEPVNYNGRSSSFQHPVPFTIDDIQIANVCVEHEHFKTDSVPDITFGGEMGGYFKNPTTEAEKLYVNLTRFNGQRMKLDTCGCRIYNCIDRVDKIHEVKSHTKHTRKCAEHLTDDDQHTNAIENNSRKNRVLNRLKEQFALTDDALNWRFEIQSNQRVLILTVPTLTTPQRNSIQTWCNNNIGANKVVIE